MKHFGIFSGIFIWNFYMSLFARLREVSKFARAIEILKALLIQPPLKNRECKNWTLKLPYFQAICEIRMVDFGINYLKNTLMTLELSYCKKQQKKSQPLNYIWE